jgi:hypothetical protein
MNIKLILAAYLGLLSLALAAQSGPPPGSVTYSPYTPEQLREFNNQPISLTEGPFGPVNTPPQDRVQAKQAPGDSKYYSQPEGEEEAEATETQSADPYTPSEPIYRF